MANYKAITNVALYTIGELIPRVLAFLLLPVFTVYLSPGDYGISSYINTVISFLFVLTTLSVNTYALRNYYKFPSEEERKNLLGNIFLFLSGWGLFMLCLEVLILPFLLKAFEIQVPFYPYFLLALVINFFDVTTIIPLVIYRVHDDAKGFVLLNVGRTVLQYLVILLLVAYFKMGLFGSYAGRLAASVPFLIIHFLVVKKKGILSVNVKQVKEALLFSLPLLPGVLSYLVISLFDRVILERYVSLSELGIYSVASTIALTLNIVIQGIYRSFEQKIFRDHGKKDFTELIDKMYKFYIGVLYIAAFCIVLFAKEVLLFLTTKNFYAAEMYIVYLVVSVVFSGVNTFLGTLLIAANRRKIITYFAFISAVASFAINLVLIKYFGVLGACIASVISFLLVSVFYFSKVFMQRKYLMQQVLFILIFFGVKYILPVNQPLFMAIGIKLLLLIGFSLLIKKMLGIKIPVAFVLKPLKYLKRKNDFEG